MRLLDLDFHRTRSAPRWASWALLAIAIAFAADLGVSYDELREAVTRNEGRLAMLGGPAEGPGRAGAQSQGVSPAEIAFARETIQRFSMPWDNLFRALESTPADKIALLAIEPDPGTGTVLISGQGKDYLAALDYVSELSQASTLTHVHLVKHELRLNDPQRPVAFSVSASWRMTR